MTKTLRSQAEVLRNEILNENHRRLVLRAPEMAGAARPGQFAELSTAGATLLRKPISIAQADPERGELTFVYRIIGKGTAALAELAPGDSLDLIAPLGNGFGRPAGPAVLVGGGVGVPPLWFMASRLAGEGLPATVVTGARTGRDLLLQEELRTLPVRFLCATDDGSAGRAGTVLTVLEELADELSGATVYACGPWPMLKALAAFCAGRGLALEVCLEAYMGCGLGVCVGCTIPTVNGMQRVCKEGPVFNATEVLWDKIR